MQIYSNDIEHLNLLPFSIAADFRFHCETFVFESRSEKIFRFPPVRNIKEVAEPRIRQTKYGHFKSILRSAT